MGQRDSGYVRKENDLYETPAWVTEVVTRYIRSRVPCPKLIWEPAAGGGKIVQALERLGFSVLATDISGGRDFLRSTLQCEAIVTNPPFGLAPDFIIHGLLLTQQKHGILALLLRTDFDHAVTRQTLFGQCPQFAKKIVLTRRIRWFEGPVKCKHCEGKGATEVFRGAIGDPATIVECRECSGKGERMVSPSENHAWFVWDWKHSGPPTIAYDQ